MPAIGIMPTNRGVRRSQVTNGALPALLRPRFHHGARWHHLSPDRDPLAGADVLIDDLLAELFVGVGHCQK